MRSSSAPKGRAEDLARPPPARAESVGHGFATTPDRRACRGKVRNMTTYGAFIELEEGIDGMVHVSTCRGRARSTIPPKSSRRATKWTRSSWTSIPRSSASALDEAARGRPVTDIEPFFKIGDVVQGTVTKITSFGAFVELKDGIDVSCTSRRSARSAIDKIKDVLKPGQVVSARSSDRPRRGRLGLSIKAANTPRSSSPPRRRLRAAHRSAATT